MVTGKSNQFINNGRKTDTLSSRPEGYPQLNAFRNAQNQKAIWQLINTLVPYGCLWYLMIQSIQLGYSYALTLVVAVLAAAFLVRIFILFHDCVHGSFFTSRNANTFFGYLLGVLVFTSFEDWRFSHLRHHVAYANLDTRGYGDVWTMTRLEFDTSPALKRLQYRFYRNPVVLFGLGAVFIFLLSNRLPRRKVKRKERMGVLFTNLLIVIVVLVAAKIIGWKTYLMIQLPVIWLAGAAGIWLFYVQHQFEGVYWARKDQWNSLRAAMEGCSFYKLPAILRWFSGNIGYHHVHHLGPRIPNYRLKKCYDTVEVLQTKSPLTLLESLSFYRLKMWDEKEQKMVGFT